MFWYEMTCNAVRIRTLKRSPNDPTINNFTCKHLQQFRPGGTKIEVWRRLGGFLGRFVGVLGLLGSSCGSRGVCRERLGRILGRFGGVQKAFWGVLGVSCMRLRVSWGLLDPSCGHLGNVSGRLGGILCLTFMPNGG